MIPLQRGEEGDEEGFSGEKRWGETQERDPKINPRWRWCSKEQERGERQAWCLQLFLSPTILSPFHLNPKNPAGFAGRGGIPEGCCVRSAPVCSTVKAAEANVVLQDLPKKALPPGNGLKMGAGNSQRPTEGGSSPAEATYFNTDINHLYVIPTIARYKTGFNSRNPSKKGFPHSTTAPLGNRVRNSKAID